MDTKTISLVEEALKMHIRRGDIPGVFLGAVVRGDVTYISIADTGTIGVYLHRNGGWACAYYTDLVKVSLTGNDEAEDGGLAQLLHHGHN
jgi:hypothetical protein